MKFFLHLNEIMATYDFAGARIEQPCSSLCYCFILGAGQKNGGHQHPKGIFRLHGDQIIHRHLIVLDFPHEGSNKMIKSN